MRTKDAYQNQGAMPEVGVSRIDDSVSAATRRWNRLDRPECRNELFDNKARRQAADYDNNIESYIQGAYAFNIRGHVLSVDEFPALVEDVIPGAAARIHVEGGPLPLAYDILDTGLRDLLGDLHITPIREGVARTVEHFRRLQKDGRLHDRDLEA